MAILWQRKVLGRTYEVRAAGQTRRLYTDGVFHSQYNPRQPVTGSIWDLLLLPAFFYPKDKIKRILVLGVGGGAVIKQLQHFMNPEVIIGIELNPNHIFVAKNYFDVNQKNVNLIEADAKRWVNDYSGNSFDMVIDDLFGEQDGEPVRAIEANTAWCRALNKLLTKDGVLVSNFVSARELTQSAYLSDESISRVFPTKFKLTSPNYENTIGVFLKLPVASQVLKTNLAKTPGLNPSLKTCRLKYRLQRL